MKSARGKCNQHINAQSGPFQFQAIMLFLRQPHCVAPSRITQQPLYICLFASSAHTAPVSHLRGRSSLHQRDSSDVSTVASSTTTAMDSECFTEPITQSDLVAASSQIMPHVINSQRIAAIVAYACSAGSALLVIVWLLSYCGGFGWDERVVFNFHPLLMALAWLIFTTQGNTQLSVSLTASPLCR